MQRPLAMLLPLIIALIPQPGEPVVLPKGTDPSQFELVGITPESISIVEGEVRLTTKQEFKDYVLTFEFKYDRPENLKADAEFRGNSGVLLHITNPPKVWPSCVQVQLAQADPGAIFAMNESKCEAGSDPLAQKAAIKAVGEWNKVQVTCQGGAIVVMLNGVEVSKGEKADPDHGVIGWQSEGKPIRFRAIRIKPLP
jgi:hypothetical protein